MHINIESVTFYKNSVTIRRLWLANWQLAGALECPVESIEPIPNREEHSE